MSDKVTLSVMDKAHIKIMKWPISPKVRKTNFKIINKMYPIADLFRKRFRFEVEPCGLCEETLQHMLYLCPVTWKFWLDVNDWLSFKINTMSLFVISHIIFHMDN